MSAHLAGTTVADPITAEIVRHGLVAITEEMKTNLMRTAYSTVISEALDYTVGLFDAEGNTLSIGLGLPMFIRGLSDAIKAKLAHYGRDGIEPEDILLTNDGYIMGSHLNHMIFTLPIFHEGCLVAFASSMAHWHDIGGQLGGKTRDIYTEGLQLPIVKIFKRGVQDSELTNIIRSNVRIPENAMGDLRAQVAAIRTGQRRFEALLKRYGLAAVSESITQIADSSERLARAAIARIPDGTYTAESYMDDDGYEAVHLPIKVTVIVDGDRMTIDLSDVSPQVAGYYNSGATAGRSAAQVAFTCLTTPTLRPINDGIYRPLEIVLPPGRIISAMKPAAIRCWMTVPMTVVDTIFKAIATAVPHLAIAGHHADLCNASLNGVDPRSGRFFIGSVSLQGGGWGAKHDSDGMCATVCINDGDTHNSPVEANEVKLPILVECYALREDSGGAGKFRGGLGVRRRVRALAPMNTYMKIERTSCPPWGLAGGRDGLANRVSIVRKSGEHVAFPNGKVVDRLDEGDAVIIESGGGGGFGDPRLRARDAVRRDLRCGYISPEAAVGVYGLDPAEVKR